MEGSVGLAMGKTISRAGGVLFGKLSGKLSGDFGACVHRTC